MVIFSVNSNLWHMIIKAGELQKETVKKVSLCSGIVVITKHTLYIANHFEIVSAWFKEDVLLFYCLLYVH